MPTSLAELFWTRIARKQTRGLDRLSPKQFADQHLNHLVDITSALHNGQYRFTPYHELLRLKGAGKLPRQIAIPTVRDRLALQAMRESLHFAFPERVPRRLPNEIVHNLVGQELATPGLSFVKMDIKSFYDTVPHAQLLEAIVGRCPQPLAKLVERSIRNPALHTAHLDRGRKRLRPMGRGIPQGLPVSNILAEVYLAPLDNVARALPIEYIRYVDDILLVGERGQVNDAEGVVRSVLNAQGLEVSEEKTKRGHLSGECDYLGYRLALPLVTVRTSSEERLVASLAADFAGFRHDSTAKTRPEWLSDTLRMNVFLDELNERITGAVSENRRYGWLFYYSEANDIALFKRLDRIIHRLWTRYIGGHPPDALKSFVVAHFETKHRPQGGYVHDYNRYSTTKSQLAFLVRAGVLNQSSPAKLTDLQVRQLFEEHKGRRLRRLELDVGRMS